MTVSLQVLDDLQTQAAGLPAREAIWIAGRALSEGAVTILLRKAGWEGAVGYWWNVLDELERYSPRPSTTKLASYLIGEAREPCGRGLLLDTDWATGLIEEASAVAWMNVDPRKHDTRILGVVEVQAPPQAREPGSRFDRGYEPAGGPIEETSD